MWCMFHVSVANVTQDSPLLLGSMCTWVSFVFMALVVLRATRTHTYAREHRHENNYH